MAADKDDLYDELRAGLRIDKDKLDLELIRQPSTYGEVSEEFTYAVSIKDKREHDLAVKIAELDKDIRDTMTAEGEKITEDKVKQQIPREQEFYRAKSAFINAAHTAAKWGALKDAYRQRADMLRSLVQLYISGYFGEVTGAAERRDAYIRHRERL